MSKRVEGDKLEKHLREKRYELIWALSHQDYTQAQICRIFNMPHRSTVMHIINRKPRDWTPKWIKVTANQ